MFLKLFPRYAGRAHRGLGSGLVVSDPSLGLSADVRVRMLLVHEVEGFRDRGVSGFDPTPSTPLSFTARVAPSWGGQATGGAVGPGDDDRADSPQQPSIRRASSQISVTGWPVGHRFVGTPRVGFGSSETGQNYRLGYSLGLLDSGEGPAFELGVNAERRKHAHINSTEHAPPRPATARW